LPTRRIHAATLTGYSQQKLRCSARQTGSVSIYLIAFANSAA
jgi:hypothetical protein